MSVKFTGKIIGKINSIASKLKYKNKLKKLKQLYQ